MEMKKIGDIKYCPYAKYFSLCFEKENKDGSMDKGLSNSK